MVCKKHAAVISLECISLHVSWGSFMFKRFMSCDVMGFQSVFCTVETQTQMPKPLQTRVQDRRLCFKLTQRKYSAPNKLVCLIEAPKIKHIKERKGKKRLYFWTFCETNARCGMELYFVVVSMRRLSKMALFFSCLSIWSRDELPRAEVYSCGGICAEDKMNQEIFPYLT